MVELDGESLRLEARILKVLNVTVEPAPGTRDRLNVSLAVQPVGDAAVLQVGPFTLELAP